MELCRHKAMTSPVTQHRFGGESKFSWGLVQNNAGQLGPVEAAEDGNSMPVPPSPFLSFPSVHVGLVPQQTRLFRILFFAGGSRQRANTEAAWRNARNPTV